MKTLKTITAFGTMIMLCVFVYPQITVDQNGRVGIGNSGPAEKLHITGNIRGNETAGALKIQTTAGYLSIGPYNTGFSHFFTDRNTFYFDKEIKVNSGNIGSYTNQDLNLRTGATTKMIIKNSNGYVGINKTSPSYTLDVNGYIQAWNVTVPSDENLKENIVEYQGNLAEINMLRPVTYKMKKTISEEAAGDSLQVSTENIFNADEADYFERQQIGFIAQEIETVFPDIVYTDNDGYKSINYSALIPVLVAAFKEQQIEIEKLKEKLNQLLNENNP